MVAVANVVGAFNAGGPVGLIKESLRLAVGAGSRRKSNPHVPSPSAGEVLLFSGCRDNQVSADTNAMSGTSVTGAMTYAFIEAIEHASVGDWRQYTYRALLQTMRDKLRVAGMRQTPQFSTSHPFDVNMRFTI
jgi:hypothetical protein